MKNQKILILVLLVLAALAAYFVFSDKDKVAVREDLRNFSIEDTASIGKIVISDKRPKTSTLSRENGQWMVNGKYKVRKDAFDVLMNTLHDMTVKNPVGKNAAPNVLKNMATYGQKIEIYDLNGNEIKTVFIGGPTNDHTGTFAMIEGAKSPYVIYIPGFEGYLSTRFFADESDWRDRRLFHAEAAQIAYVKVERPFEPESNFSLELENVNSFQLKNHDGVQISPDSLAVRRYLSGFRNLNFEGIVAPGDKVNQDSILSSQPFITFQVKKHSGESLELKAFRKSNTKRHTLPDGEIAPFDVNRFYATHDGERLYLLQYLIFDRVFSQVNNLQAPSS